MRDRPNQQGRADTRRRTRGRLTIPDLAEFIFAIAFLGGLATVFYTSLDSAAQYLSPGAAYVWQLFYPLAALVLLAVVYRKATAGGGGA